MRKENPDLKLKDKIGTITKFENYFNLREKIMISWEAILCCYLKLNSKQNMEKDSTQPTRYTLEIFTECFVNVARFWTSWEHLVNIFNKNFFVLSCEIFKIGRHSHL